MTPVEEPGLGGYAVAGLLLIMVGFVFVVVRSLLIRGRDAEEAGRLPLEEDDPADGAD